MAHPGICNEEIGKSTCSLIEKKLPLLQTLWLRRPPPVCGKARGPPRGPAPGQPMSPLLPSPL